RSPGSSPRPGPPRGARCRRSRPRSRPAARGERQSRARWCAATVDRRTGRDRTAARSRCTEARPARAASHKGAMPRLAREPPAFRPPRSPLRRPRGLRRKPCFPIVRRDMATHLPVIGGHAEGFARTTRTDDWRSGPAITFVVFLTFVVYTTWAALQGNHYY